MALKAQQTQLSHGLKSVTEFGDSFTSSDYNQQTGRPIRRNAGRKQHLAGYVDSVVIEEQGEPIELPSEDEDGEVIKPARARKRKRSPSPTPPPLDPYNDEVDELSSIEPVGVLSKDVVSPPVTFQFNIPLGFHGPLVVKLDRTLIEKLGEENHHSLPERIQDKRMKTRSSPHKNAVDERNQRAFKNLPPELRNKIYRLLFVDGHDFNFAAPWHFCRSAQLLRCCRLIHSEGPSILYGENRFVFDRNRHTRAPFWDPVPKEIGYKDVRQFLRMIGPENLVYLRDIKIVFEDATPASTPYLDHEARRYLNDQHLVDCLRILRGAKLRTLAVSFLGRRTLVRSDSKFLSYLEQIQADKVESHAFDRWYHPSKIHPNMLEELKMTMTRPLKLYAEA